MRTNMDVKLFILLLTGFSVPWPIHGCSQEDLIGCEDQFLAHLNTTREEFEAGVIPKMTEDRLRTVCGAFNVYSACVDEHIDFCSSTVQFEFRGTQKTYNYICSAGFQDHVRYAECLSSDEVEPGTDKCLFDMQLDLAASGFSRSRICAVLNDVLDCIVRATAVICGLAAANHRRVIESLAIEPLANNFACEIVSRLPPITSTTTAVMPPQFTTSTRAPSFFTTTTIYTYINGTGEQTGEKKGSSEDGGGLSTGAIIGIVVGALLLLVMVMWLIFFLLRCRNRNEQAGQGHGFVNPGYPATRAPDEEAVYENAGAAAPRHPDAPPAYDNMTYGTGLKPADLPIPENQKKTLLTDETGGVMYENMAGKE